MTPIAYHPGMALIRDQIRRRLDELGMTQAELARRSGVPRPNISRFLSGRASITTDYLDKIAKTLKARLTFGGKP